MRFPLRERTASDAPRFRRAGWLLLCPLLFSAIVLAIFMSGIDETCRGHSLPAFARGQKVGAGRFMLLRPLGRGPNGVVWLAEDGDRNQTVAIKFLPRSLGDDAFWAEISRTQKLQDPNIVRVHTLVAESPELVFIVTEHVDGLTLAATRLHEGKRFLSWNVLEPFSLQCCEALQCAHDENIIHGNIKPTNILLEQATKARLVDFGLAGLPPYASPQQLKGAAPQPTDDIYALGATFYELLTGQPIFSGDDILEQVMRASPPSLTERLRTLGNKVPPHVSATIESCLAKDPAQRPPDIYILASKLHGASEETQVIGKNGTPLPRSEKEGQSTFRRWLKRWFKI